MQNSVSSESCGHTIATSGKSRGSCKALTNRRGTRSTPTARCQQPGGSEAANGGPETGNRIGGVSISQSAIATVAAAAHHHRPRCHPRPRFPPLPFSPPSPSPRPATAILYAAPTAAFLNLFGTPLSQPLPQSCLALGALSTLAALFILAGLSTLSAFVKFYGWPAQPHR